MEFLILTTFLFRNSCCLIYLMINTIKPILAMTAARFTQHKVASIHLWPRAMSSFNNTETEKLLLKMMEIESTTGNEGSMGHFVADFLENNGWKVTRQPLAEDPKRFNVYAKRSETPRLIFNTHLDTVPPYIAPTQDEKNIYGRGSNDAKGQMACMISTAASLVSSHPDLSDQIGLLFVVGEEVDHVGMTEANKLNLNPEYLIVGEPTELKFATIQKGAYKVILKSTGVAGHSGYPSSGVSAIHKLIPVLNDVISYEWPKDKNVGDTTFNIGIISGGQAQNAWAEAAEARIFFRVTTSVEDIREKLKKVVNGRADIVFLSSNEPVILSDLPIEGETDEVAFNTDLAYYEKLDSLKARFLFGAGSIKNAHSKDEFMPKSELEECQKKLTELTIKLLQ